MADRCDLSGLTDAQVSVLAGDLAPHAPRAAVEEAIADLWEAITAAPAPGPHRALWGATAHTATASEILGLFCGRPPEMVKVFSGARFDDDPRAYALVRWCIERGVSPAFNQRLRDTVPGGLAAIARGDHDARLYTWARNLNATAADLAAVGAELDLAVEAEMDQGTPSSGADQDTRYKRGFTPREFKGAHNRIAEILSEVAPAVTLSPVWAGWNLDGSGGRRITDWCPDLDYPVVRRVGVDIYPQSPASQINGWDRDANAIAFLDWAASVDRQVCIPETGVNDAGQVTADWIGHTADWANRKGLHHVLYFNSTGVLGDTRLTSPEARAALCATLPDR